ncbi:type IV pilus modification protein PilV [Peristeroidobacter soli]|jgi:type IV pilus assembly protein PilV|uniref:type IV pilus modification protein PilV n=1 Tax=Peristeroidobacter soli TaxID=2497877 RepID=UPI00130085AF|nr:type IV pilus modification protein PilV [Peristeroidobacter soli]
MKANFTNRGWRARRHGAGMTLIEVLVTLVIISVGLLGVAALQLTTVRNNYDSYVRSQAAVLAADMLDRMRVNRAVALSDANPYTVALGPVTASGTQPARDIVDWKATLAAQLVGGDGAITVTQLAPPTGPGTPPRRAIVTITVQWGERNAGDEDNTLRFVTSSQI